MSLMSDSVIFIVDSSQAITGAGTGSWTSQINIPKGLDYDRVCVLQAIIPKSYYLVNAPYNTFILSENGTRTTITMTPGNYNVKSFATLISALLTASSSQGWVYTITYPNSITQVDTGKFLYTVSGNASQPSIIFPSTSLVYEQFGFSVGSTNVFVASAITSSNVVKFQVEDIIFVHSSISSNNDQTSKNDVLQEIYASSTPNYSNVIYQNSGAIEAYSKKLTSQNNNVYSFTLTDEKDNPIINLNGLNCVMTLVVYKKDAINQLLARNILTNRGNMLA